MPFEKTFRTAEVSKELGSSRLSFAPEDMLFKLLKCRSGSLGTLALLFDKGNKVKLAVDRDLKGVSGLCIHPSVDTTTVTVETDEYFERLLPLLKHEPTFVTVTSYNA
jgi:Ala-tRNA(Pro) deacylase